jgi:uncharacterized protein
MKIYIKAKPKSSKEYILKIDNTHFTVAVKEPPVKGLANRAIINSLAKYFDKPKLSIFIISGMTSKNKVFEIPISLEELEVKDVQKKLF